VAPLCACRDARQRTERGEINDCNGPEAVHEKTCSLACLHTNHDTME
jgi:hypothetical protein